MKRQRSLMSMSQEQEPGEEEEEEEGWFKQIKEKQNSERYN